MAEIIWTEPALQQLDAIADYISLDNPNTASRLVISIFERIDHLQNHPNSGKEVDELKPSVYREIVYPPCRIFYRFDDDKVFILYIIREEQHFNFEELTQYKSPGTLSHSRA